MGLLSWLRSHRSGMDTEPVQPPAPAADAAGPAGPDHEAAPSTPSASPAPVAAWRSLPPIQRSTTPPTLVTDPTGFRASLHDQRDTLVTGQLGHLVSPQAPSGLVHGLITAPSAPVSTMDRSHTSVQRFERPTHPTARPGVLAGREAGAVPAAAPPAVALQRIEAVPLTHAAPADTGTPPLPTAEPTGPTEPRVTVHDSTSPAGPASPDDRSAGATGETGDTENTSGTSGTGATERARSAESGGPIAAVPAQLDADAGRTVMVPTTSPAHATPPTVQTTPSTAPAAESPVAQRTPDTARSPRTGSGGREPRPGLGAPLTELPPTAATVQRAVAGTTATPHPQPAPPEPQPAPQPPARTTEPVVSAQPPPVADELPVVPLSFQPARMTQIDLPSALTAMAEPTEPTEPAPPAATEADSVHSAGVPGSTPVTLEPPAGDLPLQRLGVAEGPSAQASPTRTPPTGTVTTAAQPGDTSPAPEHSAVPLSVPPTAPLLGATTPPVPSGPTPDPPSGSVPASDRGVTGPSASIQLTTVDQRSTGGPEPVPAEAAAAAPPALVPLLAQRSVELLTAPEPTPAPAPAPAGATTASATTRPPGLFSTGPDVPPEAPVARLRWESPQGSPPAPSVVPSGTVQRSAAPWPEGAGSPTSAAVTPAPPRRTSTAPATPARGPIDAGAVAVAAGIAQRMSDGSVVFGPSGTVQRALGDTATPPPEEPATPQPPADVPPTAPTDTAAAAAGEPPASGGTDQTHPAGGAATPTVTDELVRSLFGPLSRLLKAELRLERERAGRLIDTRH